MGRIDASLGMDPRTVSRYEAPDAALRRLDLKAPADGGFLDLVQLGAGELQRATRRVDAERDQVERTNIQTTTAYEVLTTVQERLGEIQKLSQANARSGTSPFVRRDNQKQIDALLEEVQSAFKSTSVEGVRLFEGELTLRSGSDSVALKRLDLDRLGQVFVNGRSLSLADLASGERLDTTRRQGMAIRGAAKSINDALETVTDLRQRLQAFTRDSVAPRLGDLAEVASGLMESVSVQTIGSGDVAMEVLQRIRLMTMQTTGVAAAVGADGWDRQRVIDLLS